MAFGLKALTKAFVAWVEKMYTIIQLDVNLHLTKEWSTNSSDARNYHEEQLPPALAQYQVLYFLMTSFRPVIMSASHKIMTTGLICMVPQ